MTVDAAFGILRSLPAEWGATEMEVRDVESMLGVRFPAPLCELMLRTGRREHMGWLFPEGEIAPLFELPQLNEVAAEIMEGDAPALRPAFPYVVLQQHEGYAFSFIQAERFEADPEVMYYEESRGYRRRPGGETIGQCIAAAIQRALSRVGGGAS